MLPLCRGTVILRELTRSIRFSQCPVCRASITDDTPAGKPTTDSSLEAASTPSEEDTDENEPDATTPTEPISVTARALPAAQRHIQSASPVASSSSVTLDSAVGGRRGE